MHTFRPKLLDLHMLSEFVKVLTIVTLAVLGIFFGTGEFKKIVDLFTQFGIPLHTLLTVTMLQIPTGAMYSLPAGILASTVFVLARMYRDSEIVALDTLGVPRWRLLVPLLVIGIACGAVSFAIGEYVAPEARYLSSRLFLVGITRSDFPFASKGFIELKDPEEQVQKILVFGSPAGTSVNGFLLFDLTKPGSVNLTWSQSAQWKHGTWDLTRGMLFELLSPMNNGLKESFEHMQFGGVAEAYKQLENKPQEDLDKTTAQLRQEIDSFRKAKRAIPNETLLQYYRRQSQPLSCVLLVLAAAPIVFMRSRGHKLFPFVYCGVLMPAYFLLQQICLSLACNGRLEPMIAAWLPASILCTFGLIFATLTRH